MEHREPYIYTTAAGLKTPFIDLLPPLSTEEFKALAADIQANSVQVPIVIDEEGNILDGHHRYKVDPDAPTRVIAGLSPDEKVAYVLGSNMKRRNLSPDQKAEVRKKMMAVALALNNAGKRQEEIGAILGVARETVRDWFRTIGASAISSKTDVRVKIAPEADATILMRLDSGESQEQVAADYGVTQRAISKRATKARKKKEKEKAASTPEPTEEVKPMFDVQPGDIWQAGNHRLMCGDVYNEDDLTALLAGDTATALITDPPYGIDYRPDWNKWDDSPPDFDQVTGDDKPFNPVPFLAYPVVALFGANYFSDRLPIGGWICWDKRTDATKDEMFGSPFELAWYRSVHTTRKAVMVRVLHGGVVNADSECGNNEKRWVATQKPVAVIEQVLDALTKPEDVVLDPFVGSGTTLLACESKGMQCLAMDIEPRAVAITLERWQKKTGQAPACIARRQDVRN